MKGRAPVTLRRRKVGTFVYCFRFFLRYANTYNWSIIEMCAALFWPCYKWNNAYTYVCCMQVYYIYGSLSTWRGPSFFNPSWPVWGHLMRLYRGCNIIVIIGSCIKGYYIRANPMVAIDLSMWVYVVQTLWYTLLVDSMITIDSNMWILWLDGFKIWCE